MIRKMKHNDFNDVNRLFKQVHKIHVENRPDIFIDSDPCPY